MNKKKYVFALLIGLLIVVSGLTVTTSANAFTLRNFQTNYCLAVAGVPPQNQRAGAAIVAWSCDGTPGQQWGWNREYQSWPATPSSRNPGWGSLVSSVNANRVLGVANGTNVWYNGAPLVDWTQTADVNQAWLPVWVRQDFDTFNPHDCYYFENGNGQPFDSKVMGVLGGSLKQGAPVVVWDLFLNDSLRPDYIGHPDQLWCVYP